METDDIISISETLLGIEHEYEISTGLLVKQGTNYIYAVQNRDRWRLVGKDIWETGLVGIGGKLEKDETLIDCVRRECKEELASDVDIEDSSVTYLVTERSVTEIDLSTSDVTPRPYFIILIEKTEARRKPYTLVISYKGLLVGNPQPKDVSALLFADDSVLVHLNSGPKTVRFLREQSARFLEQVPLPDTLSLRPYGTLQAYLKLKEYACASKHRQ